MTHHTYILLLMGHDEKLHNILDEYLENSRSLIVAKEVTIGSGFNNYNILQVGDLVPCIISC